MGAEAVRRSSFNKTAGTWTLSDGGNLNIRRRSIIIRYGRGTGERETATSEQQCRRHYGVLAMHTVTVHSVPAIPGPTNRVFPVTRSAANPVGRSVRAGGAPPRSYPDRRPSANHGRLIIMAGFFPRKLRARARHLDDDVTLATHLFTSISVVVPVTR